MGRTAIYCAFHLSCLSFIYYNSSFRWHEGSDSTLPAGAIQEFWNSQAPSDRHFHNVDQFFHKELIMSPSEPSLPSLAEISALERFTEDTRRMIPLTFDPISLGEIDDTMMMCMFAQTRFRGKDTQYEAARLVKQKGESSKRTEEWRKQPDVYKPLRDMFTKRMTLDDIKVAAEKAADYLLRYRNMFFSSTISDTDLRVGLVW